MSDIDSEGYAIEPQLQTWLHTIAEFDGVSPNEALNRAVREYKLIRDGTSLQANINLHIETGLRRLAESPVAGEAYLQFACQPTDTTTIPLDQLREVAEYAGRHPSSGWPLGLTLPNRGLPYTVDNGLEFLYSAKDFSGRHRFDYWTLKQDAFFFTISTGMESLSSEYGRGVEFVWLARDITEALFYVRALADALKRTTNYTGDFATSVVVGGVQDKKLITLNPERDLIQNYVCHSNKIEVYRRFEAEDLKSNIQGQAEEILAQVFWHFDGFGLPSDLLPYLLSDVLRVRR